MTDVDRLKFKYIIVFTCKSKLTRGSAYSRRSDELVTVMSRARDVGESCMSPTLVYLDPESHIRASQAPCESTCLSP